MEKTPEEIKKGLEYLSSRDPAKKFKLWQEGIAYDWQEDAAADALAYIQQLEAQVPRWISVDERLPEVGDDVLVCSGARIDIGYYDGLWWETYTIRDIPTHWMHLPQPPKEE